MSLFMEGNEATPYALSVIEATHEVGFSNMKPLFCGTKEGLVSHTLRMKFSYCITVLSIILIWRPHFNWALSRDKQAVRML